MKRIIVLIVNILLIAVTLSSCSKKQNEEKDEFLNIDTIIDNGNCQLRKTNYSGSNNDIIDLILDDDLVTIKYGTFPNTYLREYEENYYFYNSKIYYRKLL